jgi:hypothetical protein
MDYEELWVIPPMGYERFDCIYIFMYYMCSGITLGIKASKQCRMGHMSTDTSSDEIMAQKRW